MTVDGMLRFISAIGSVASVVVAIVAIVIAVKIGEQESEEALRMRTLEVHRTFLHLDAIQALSELARSILHETKARRELSDESSYFRTLSEVYHDFTKDDLQSVRVRVSTFLTMVRVLRTCGWDPTSEGSTDCSRELLFAVGFEDTAWTYFGIRPALYCDDVMRAELGVDDISNIPETSDLFRLETMIIHWLQWDYQKGKAPEYPVFRTLEDRGRNSGVVVRPNIDELCGRAGKASVTAWFTPEVRRQLRRLAADRDTTLQALLGEAVNDLFAKHGLPELVERD